MEGVTRWTKKDYLNIELRDEPVMQQGKLKVYFKLSQKNLKGKAGL
jgi:hypothetical protein